MRTIAGVFFALVAIVLINAYRQYGVDGVRMWFGAKFLNVEYDKPQRAVPRRTVRGRGGKTFGRKTLAKSSGGGGGGAF